MKKTVDKNFFEQTVSEEFRNKVFKSVAVELEINRKRHARTRMWIWSSAFSLCLVIFLSWYYVGSGESLPFPKNPDMALVPSHEIEMYENLDLIEHLDELQASGEQQDDTNNDESSI